MTDHEKAARDNFLAGYNCSQAIMLAFSDVTGMDNKTALTVSSSFGGGMARLREVCGAVSGIFMVAGILWGYSDPSDKEAKKQHYQLIQDMAARLREENGSIVCRELLGLGSGPSDPVPEERTAQYYKRRPCADYIGSAARVLDEFIAEKENKKHSSTEPCSTEKHKSTV